jgi:polyisoprenoid-binding protein YceI
VVSQVRWLAIPAVLVWLVALVSGCANSGQTVSSQQSVSPRNEPNQVAGDAPSSPDVKGTHFVVIKGKSTAQYRVGEQFAGVSLPTEAVGVTSDVEGELVLGDDGQLTGSLVKVYLPTLKSDKERRDIMVRSVLKVNQYPFAEYRVTGTTNRTAITPGVETTLKAKGMMTLAGVERPVEFAAKVKLDGNILHVTATSTLKMSDFNVKPPSIAGFVTVNDDVQVTVNVTAKA